MTAAPFGPAEFRTAANVSRETTERLADFVALLTDWNGRHNLVSRASLGDVWRRHIWDCAQLVEWIPLSAGSLVDLGSGAGFPGLVLALLLRDRAAFRTVLFEATRKKAEFLAAAASRLGIAVEIRNARVEGAAPEPFDIVTARACAPLSRLLEYALGFQSPRTINLFLKGQNVGDELTEARKIWKMTVQEKPSHTAVSGVILLIGDLHPERKVRR
ncbi:MAG: 16S rRNA (guanine(527)-N(7))-methyltransferase RsmG [Rhizomicrobium sp.]